MRHTRILLFIVAGLMIVATMATVRWRIPVSYADDPTPVPTSGINVTLAPTPSVAATLRVRHIRMIPTADLTIWAYTSTPGSATEPPTPELDP